MAGESRERERTTSALGQSPVSLTDRSSPAKVGDEEGAIVDALNALRHRYTYVFTTGGIGPTHGDITADCVAKAFGVPIDTDTRALAILHEWVETTGAEMNESRLRMTRVPKGAELILNRVSGAPGFWIGNVIVMAGARPKQIGGPAHAGPRQIARPKGGGSGGLRAHRHEVSDTVT